MKHLFIIACAAVMFENLAHSQTGLTAVMVDTNQVVVRPTNFITANGLVTGNSGGVAPFAKTRFVTYANLLSETVGSSTTSVTNSFASVTISATNTATNAKSAIRLMARVNSRASAGLGTGWQRASHTAWLAMDAAIGTNAFVRGVVGLVSFSQTNVAIYPTNRAVGFEIGRTNPSVENLRIRIIAHDGTNATNGPWVSTGGNIFQRHTVGVAQKTNGQVKLYVAIDDFTDPQELTNAAITGGPAGGDGPQGGDAWDLGLFQDGTNSFSAGASVYTGWMSWTN